VSATAQELPHYLTVQELADVLRVSYRTVLNRRERGEPMPPSVRVGTRVLFPRDEALAWIEAHREAVP
jgi:excisionase family DNA binding protein